jgi:hypothetical protein
MDGLEFNEAEHTYKFQGRLVESVTTVLKPLTSYHMIHPVKLEEARQRGNAVHKMVELWCKDDLDEKSLPLWMIPALEQWKSFVKYTKFKVISSEMRVYHPQFKYAGTLDLYGCMNEKDNAIVDIKRSFGAGGVIGYQLAAYKEAHTNGDTKCKRFALRLREDGAFKLLEYKDHLDFTHFLTCLNMHRLKERHNG